MKTEHIAVLVKHAKTEEIIGMLEESLKRFKALPSKQNRKDLVFACTAFLTKDLGDEIGTDKLVQELRDGNAAMKAFNVHKNKN